MLNEVSPGSANDDGEVVDVIVIGSGFGGAVAACRLAQAGFEVTVLERGRRFEASDFPKASDFGPLPADTAFLPDWRRWVWANNEGLWDVLDLEELVSVQAAGWGGGSLIYANVHLRPPDEVFDEPWPEIYRGGAHLQPYFDLAAYMLDVAPVTRDQRFGETKLVKTLRLEKAAEDLGRGAGFFHPPLAVRYSLGPDGGKANIHGVEQGVCTGCGACCTGCPEKAKNTLDFNYLALAERHGARALTQCEAIDIVENDAGFEVQYFNHLTARLEKRLCTYLFLCAGAVHTTRLLARASLRSSEGGRFVGAGYFPGGDALGVVYDTKEDLLPSLGPTITTALVHRDPDNPKLFSMIQDGGYAREVSRAVGMLRAPLWLGRNRSSRADGVRPVAPAPKRERDPAGFVLASPLDELLDAVSSGAFDKVISKRQRRAFSALLDELAGPLMLPGVVERTIETLARKRWKEFCLTQCLNPSSFPLSWLLWFERWCVRNFLGTSDEIAKTALRELVNYTARSRHDVARDVLGYTEDGADRRLMLLAMGCDAAKGFLHYDKNLDRLYADLDLFTLAPGYSRNERLMTDIAHEVGGELRTNPAWEFLGKPITVHNQGGCGMGPRGKSVTNQDGQVWGSERLYVLDGSLLCKSVGVNPSATILALAERNILQFIRSRKGRGRYPNWPEQDAAPGAQQYRAQRAAASEWITARRAAGWKFAPPRGDERAPKSKPIGLAFREEMRGHYAPTNVLPPRGPSGDAEYRRLETSGRPDLHISVELDVAIADLSVFMEDELHSMAVQGKIVIALPGQVKRCEAEAVGRLQLPVKRRKPYGLSRRDRRRRQAQKHFAGRYTTVRSSDSRTDLRLMTYTLEFKDDAGKYWVLKGKKRIKDDPGLDAWRDTSSLLVKLFGPMDASPSARSMLTPLAGIGVIHVELNDFLFKQLPSIRVTGTTDAARVAWATATFASFFFGTLQRIYLPEVKAFFETLFRVKVLSQPYAPFQSPPRR